MSNTFRYCADLVIEVRSSVLQHRYVLREDGHVLGKSLEFEAEGEGKKGRQKRTWKRWVGEESIKAGLSRENVLWRSRWVVGV